MVVRLCDGLADLVLLAGALTVLGQGLQGLGDEVHIGLVDVEAQQAQAACGASTHDVQELQSLTHQVVVGFIILTSQEVLEICKYTNTDMLSLSVPPLGH